MKMHIMVKDQKKKLRTIEASGVTAEQIQIVMREHRGKGLTKLVNSQGNIAPDIAQHPALVLIDCGEVKQQKPTPNFTPFGGGHYA